jgi:LysM repeat protein
MRQDEAGSSQVGTWMMPMVRMAHDTLETNGKPSLIVPGTPLPIQAPGTPGVPESSYTVVSGDSLSLISGKFWGDMLLWPILYKKNAGEIGPNHNLIKAGQRLTIPNIRMYSPKELDKARSDGRNWR